MNTEYKMTGIERIAHERFRQIDNEGWTPENDAQHENGELIRAAECYARAADETATNGYLEDDCPPSWPWDVDWWKPSEDPIRNLEKAGALIAAEIDRLQRENRES